jgi:hypothetical protein
MLSEAKRLEDVDIAIELLPKVAEQAEFRKWWDRRRESRERASDPVLSGYSGPDADERQLLGGRQS